MVEAELGHGEVPAVARLPGEAAAAAAAEVWRGQDGGDGRPHHTEGLQKVRPNTNLDPCSKKRH